MKTRKLSLWMAALTLGVVCMRGEAVDSATVTIRGNFVKPKCTISINGKTKENVVEFEDLCTEAICRDVAEDALKEPLELEVSCNMPTRYNFKFVEGKPSRKEEGPLSINEFLMRDETTFKNKGEKVGKLTLFPKDNWKLLVGDKPAEQAKETDWKLAYITPYGTDDILTKEDLISREAQYSIRLMNVEDAMSETDSVTSEETRKVTSKGWAFKGYFGANIKADEKVHARVLTAESVIKFDISYF